MDKSLNRARKRHTQELKLSRKDMKDHREQSRDLVSLHMFKTPTDGVMGPTG